MEEIHNTINPASTNDEIDLVALAKQVWKGRKTIFIALGIGAILGVFIALFSPKEYTAKTVMVPQLEGSSKSGGLSSLAALAGISVDMSASSELSPLIYPQIVGSIPFQLELMNTPLNFSKVDRPVSLFEYYTKYSKPSVLSSVKKYTIGLPGMLVGAIRGKTKPQELPEGLANKPLSMTEEQYLIKKFIDAQLTLDVNPKEGYLTLSTRMPEPLVAAQLAQKAQELLQRYITEFKIEKARTNLEFIQGRYDENKIEFEKAQVSLAMINDRSKAFTSTMPRIEVDRIQTRYTIAFGVYQELAKQLEQAKIQVKKDTPVFTIVEPASIPSEKSKPKRAMILVIWLFLGGTTGIALVFGKHFLADWKKKWNETGENL